LQGFRPLRTATLQTRILPPAGNPRKPAPFRVVHGRLLTGAGTPREFHARVSASLTIISAPNGHPMSLLIVVAGDQTAAMAVSFKPDPLG
jgi:hypothetical protein